jgi:GT2 family glycosyltransferase
MAHHAEGRALADTPRALPAPDARPIRSAWMPSGFLALDLPALPGNAPEGPLALHLDGQRIPPPLARFELPGGALLLTFAPAACGPGAVVELRRDGALVAAVALGAPRDEVALLADRPAAARSLLLGRLCAAAPVFRPRTDPRFGALCQRFAAALAKGQDAAQALAADALSLWQLPASAPSGDGAWHLLTRGALRPVAAPAGRAILLEGRPAEGAVLVPPAGAPVPLAAPAAGLPALLPVARKGGAGRAALFDALARRADPAAAATLRDLQLLAPRRASAMDSPALPVGGALELALPDGEGGVFLRGWLRDPLGLVRAMVLTGPGARIPLAALHRLPRPDLAEALRRAPQGDGGPRPGFVAHLPDAGLPAGAVQLSLELRLESGQAITLTAPPGLLPPAAARDAILASVDPACATEALMEGCISPAVARLQRAAMAPGAPAERIAIGPHPPRRPCARIVVPLWRNLSFLRAQVAGFARDPAFRGEAAPELTYVLDSPEQREEVLARLRALSLLHDLPLTLLIHDRNRGYASACNAGAAGASAPLLAFLNSDVVAEAPGWLAPIRRRFARGPRIGAVGARLLYPGGAIQHAGLFYAPAPDGGWGCNHFRKGFPRGDALAARAREVPAVTGAALVVRREAFEAAGGFCTDYVLGDFEDSDLCLKLRAAGHAIHYEAASELVHHERQSIAAHPGHAGTLAALHNRRLHAARWGEAIAALMRRAWAR